MSIDLTYSCAAHLLNRQDYKEEIIEEHKPWIKLLQHCHEILLYEISKDFSSDIQSKRKFVDEVEFTYRFIHPAIAQTFKYTYSNKLSISYIGNNNSLFAKASQSGRLSNTKKQIVLIGAASALQYLESKGVSHYCLDENHIIFDKMQFPKLVCCGVPSAFKPDDWNDEASTIKSFGKFAQSILPDPNQVPAPLRDLIDKCINFESAGDSPTLDDLVNALCDKNNYLNDVTESTVKKYITWLKFQDKFPCDYFFELKQMQVDELVNGIDDTTNSIEVKRKRYDDSEKESLSIKLYKGHDGYPKDILGAMYLALKENTYKLSYIQKTIFRMYGVPDWLRNLNPKYKENFFENLDYDHNVIFFNSRSEFNIDNEDNREKLFSTEKNDIEFVINSYLNGKNDFPKSQQAAFYHVKDLLKKNQDDPFLLTELGKMYENGIGTVKNYKKAIACFELASNSDPEAKQDLERAESKQEELEDQISNLSPECKANIEKADSNNFKKLMYVGFSFLYGLNGFITSHIHAIQYYKKAAEIDPYVYCMIGNLFRLGNVLSQNTHKAVKYYKLSNLHGCLRGQYYDGFMQMHNYYPLESCKKHFKKLDRYFFDYKNQQGASNPFNYCKVVHTSQQHFPVMFNMYIDSYKSFYSRSNDIEERRQNDSTYIKESINIENGVDNIEDEEYEDKSHHSRRKKHNIRITLNDTEVQITVWFTLYQLKYLVDNGLLLQNKEPDIDLYKDQRYYYAINDLSRIFRYRRKKKVSPQHILYRELKEKIPEKFRLFIKEEMKKTVPIDETLNFFENNFVSKKVDSGEFEEFIRKVRNFVVFDSAKIVVSEKTDKADSGDKVSLQECARDYFFGLNSFPINYRESFRYYQILAGESYNDPNAQMWVGIMLSKGIGVNYDFKEAIKWFKKSSDQNYTEGRLNYALFLEYYNRKLKDPMDPNIPYMNLLIKCGEELNAKALFEIGKLKESHVSWDYGRSKSIKYYQKASQLGHIESTRRLYHVYKKLGMEKEQKSLLPFLKTINDPKYIFICANALYDHGDYENSLKYAKIFLPVKDPKFRKLYADHLLFGHGIQKDVKAAKKFYIAASKKYPKAVIALADIYVKGIDCKRDLMKARKIYFMAYKESSWSAQSAYMKLYCDFCEENGFHPVAFRFQLKIAEEKKVKESQYKVGMSLIDPTHDECKKNIKRGIEFLTMSADQRYPIAAYELGKMYIYGNYGQKRDFEKGVEYLKLASNSDYEDATMLLGEIYQNGIGTIPDNEEAMDYFTKAACKNNPKAKYFLYLNDKVDMISRDKYLVEAAEQGYDEAEFAYGVKLIKSAINRTDSSYQTGIDFLQRAINQNNKEAKAYYDKNIAKYA